QAARLAHPHVDGLDLPDAFPALGQGKDFCVARQPLALGRADLPFGQAHAPGSGRNFTDVALAQADVATLKGQVFKIRGQVGQRRDRHEGAEVEAPALPFQGEPRHRRLGLRRSSLAHADLPPSVATTARAARADFRRLTSSTVSLAVRLVQISMPLKTIMLSSSPKKAYTSLSQVPAKSPVCKGRIEPVTSSSVDRSETRRMCSTTPV